MTYRNLNDAAEASGVVLQVLASDLGPSEAADKVNSLMRGSFRTTESSVRRWREQYGPGQAFEFDQGPDDELAEDVGTGVNLDDDSAEVDPNWAGFQPGDRESLHGKLDTALNAVRANPEDVAGLRVSQYQMVTKDAEGQARVHDLYAVKLLVKTKDVTPGWPVVQPATPTLVRPVQSSGRVRKGERVAVLLPDPQIGYRFYQDDHTYDPFHDERAMNVALQVVRDVSPDEVIHLGDFQDFPAFGRYEQEQAFAATTQKGVDRGHEFLAEVYAAAPNAHQKVLEGNHDRRLQNMIVANAKAAFGLKRAGDVDTWPVLSVPFLCRFEDYDVEYIEGYPAGQLWINDNLRVIHGVKVRSSQSTAAAVVKDDDVSTIFGHIHRCETEYLTRQNRQGGRTLVAHSPGCLCRIDGAVPSVKGSTDLTGRPVESYENWQQGLTIVHYEPGDGGFSLEPLFIDTFNGYRVRYGDRVYSPSI